MQQFELRNGRVDHKLAQLFEVGIFSILIFHGLNFKQRNEQVFGLVLGPRFRNISTKIVMSWRFSNSSSLDLFYGEHKANRSPFI